MGDFGAELTRLMNARGFGVRELARIAYSNPGHISNLRSGKSRPSPELAARLDELLRAGGTLAALAPARRRSHVEIPSGPAQQEQKQPVTRAMLPATRGDEYPGRLDHVLTHPEITDLIAVAQLREHVRRLDERYDSSPASALIAETGRRLGQIEFLAMHARRSDVRRELRGAEAEAAVLMGQLIWDASQRRAQDAAATYLRQAVDAARQRGDHAYEGLALLRSSMIDLYGRKDPHSGLQVAQQAVAAGSRVSKVLAGLATLHTAEAHAMQGNRADCEKALSQAKTHFGQITPEDPAIDLYSGTQFGRMAGSCYLFLGDAAAAASVLEQTALTLRDGSKAEAIVLANLTRARIRLGRIDEAVAVLNKTLDVVEVNWGGGGLNIAFAAGRELRRWQDTTAVRDVRDRLLALMAEA